MNNRNIQSFVRKWILVAMFSLPFLVTANVLASSAEPQVEQDVQPTETGVAQEDNPVEPNGQTDSVAAVEEDAEVTAVSGNSNWLSWISYWQLDETSGSTYVDSIGNRDGSCTNCPTVESNGQVGNAQSFDGVNDAISVLANSEFDWSGSDSFTIELWVNAENGQSCVGNEVMLGRGNAGANYWSLGCDANGRVSFQLSDGSTSVNLLSTQSIDDGNWHHIAVLRDASSNTNSLYINSALETAMTQGFSGSFAPTTASVDIGHLDSSNYFEGILDEIAVYRGILPELILKNHYYLVRHYQESCDTVEIMPMGDSITRGFGSDGAGSGNEEDYTYNHGYRSHLYDSLTTAGYDFDFIGRLSHGENNGLTFDLDHNGFGGETADEIAFRINNGMTWGGDKKFYDPLLTPTQTPEVILLHVGTNDITRSEPNTASDVNDILQNVDNFDSRITVILAKIVEQGEGPFPGPFIPPSSSNIIPYNASLESMANTRIGNGDKIIQVDQFSVLDYATPPYVDMYDDLHPGEPGYLKMAPVWFDALDDFLPDCDAPIFNSVAVTETTVDTLYTYQVNATGAPFPTYSLQTAPTGMNIDVATGRISWTPTAQQTGSNEVTVLATNSEGVDSHTFNINVERVVYLPFVIR